MAKSDFDVQLNGTPGTMFRARQLLSAIAVGVALAGPPLVFHNGPRAGLAATLHQTAQPLEARAASAPSVDTPESAKDPVVARYEVLGEFLAKRYRVSQEVTTELVIKAHATGRAVGVDPLLILAVIAVESRFNPIAESVMGAKGLMQVMPQYHRDKLEPFGGSKAVFDPEANITVGAKIIKEYLVRTRNLAEALQMYVGAADGNDTGYAAKVLAELQRLKQVVKLFDSEGKTAQTDTRGAHNPG